MFHSCSVQICPKISCFYENSHLVKSLVLIPREEHLMQKAISIEMLPNSVLNLVFEHSGNLLM